MAQRPEDRIDRLRRALELAASGLGAQKFFLTLLDDTKRQVQAKRQEVPRVPQSGDHGAELAELEARLERMQARLELVAEMVFRTILDTYNTDAGPGARLGAQPTETAVFVTGAVMSPADVLAGRDGPPPAAPEDAPALLAEIRALLDVARGRLAV